MKSILWKKKQIEKFRLYVILDKDICGKRNILKISKVALNGGADIIQFRFGDTAKTKDILAQALELKEMVTGFGKIFMINNRLDLAQAVGACGIHLGQNDMPVDIARKILGPYKIIGLSCHSLSQVKGAARQDVDYISIGPIFKTPTKPEYHSVGTRLIQETANNIKIPFLAIGGINKRNIDKVKAAGAKMVAVCRAVCQAKDVYQATKQLKEKL